MKVTHEGNTYSLPVGETTVYDIRLQEGDNYVTFTGNLTNATSTANTTKVG